MSSTSEGPARKANKSETTGNTLITESEYRIAEEHLIEHLSSVFQKAEIGIYQGSERAYARVHLPSEEELTKITGFLDLLNISYWDDHKKLTLTIDNHFDIEALVEKGVIDISSLSDDEYRTLILGSGALYEEHGRGDEEDTAAIPLAHLKPIPEIFSRTTKDTRSEFDDMTEQKEGVAIKHSHGDISYLYKQFSKKYRREPGRLFRKTKEGEVSVTREEQDALLAEAQHGNERARNEYLVMNMGLVYFTAFNMARLFPQVNQADMIQEGLIQMNKCIDSFVVEKGRFSSYAVVSMEFRMLTYAQVSMREIFMPQSRQDTITKIQRLEKRNISLYGTKLSVQKIAKELAISTYNAEKLLRMKQEITDAEFLDITDEALENEPELTQPDTLIDTVQQNELRSVSSEILDSLTPREALVMRMRFGIDTDAGDMTLEEIGERFDITRERVRQIEAKALRKLKHPSRLEVLRSYR